MIKLYREGKLSLSTLATRLELPVSETLDLLAEFGIESPMDYDEILNAVEGPDYVIKGRSAQQIPRCLKTA